MLAHCALAYVCKNQEETEKPNKETNDKGKPWRGAKRHENARQNPIEILAFKYR